MSKIRPFINQNIIKVLTGIRRCGKSVMLEFIKDELKENGKFESSMISINFESRAVDYVKSIDVLKCQLLVTLYLTNKLSRVRWRFCKAKYYLTFTAVHYVIIKSGAVAN